ncbi:lactonase family protein [Lederbergia lenta]|uniref:lactonase family protein n=1 Tax=Lederbergia lenta TaxID=1467 RepID=UPI00203D46C4|nr:lactonase family protein [Lederbergia lenta]MCM3113278.1 lactonase family protein [Lederbergia lenta]
MTMNQYDVFVGSYGKATEESIHWLRFNAADGKLIKVASISGVENPSFVTLNHTQNRLYSVSEVENGKIVSFDIDYVTGKLTELNRQSTKGSSPCFVEVHESDQYIFTANYGGENITVHPLGLSGHIDPVSEIKVHSNRGVEVNATSHPHCIRNVPNTNVYTVADLGLNRLFLYEFNEASSELVLINEVEVPVNSGPRHISFHPHLRRLYIVNELNSTILVYSYDGKVENLKWLQTIDTIPWNYEGSNYCADIHVSPSGSYLYASNRGHHSITAYKILEDGKLDCLEQTSTLGEWPRNFAIVPDERYILVANEHTNSIVVMQIRENGSLQETEQIYSVSKPVCLQILRRKE